MDAGFNDIILSGWKSIIQAMDMINPLQHFFSTENAAAFGTLGQLSSPANERRAPSASVALKHSGAHRLTDIVERRSSARPITLGQVDEFKRPDISRQFITGLIKRFFLSDSIYLEKHRGSEYTARKPLQHFDVREISRLATNSSKDTSIVYCCRYGESAHDPEAQTRPDGSWNEELLASHPKAIRLAIPSSAGLEVPDAASLVTPLVMLPREYILEGEAGAFLVVSPNTFTYSIELYWSTRAFQNSLNQMQELGRLLIEENALESAIRDGKGIRDVHRGSALLSKAYESVATAALEITPQLLISGIWGIALLPRKDNTYLCQLGTMGCQIEEPISDGHHKVLLTKNPCIIVTNLSVKRDELGVVSMDVEKISIVTPDTITWHNTLPELN